MCPISFPICIPYWIWILLILFGLTSWKAALISAGISGAILGIGLYRYFKRRRSQRKKQ